MSSLHFEWHPSKAATNVRKHGVTFEEAQSVFGDERVLPLRRHVIRIISARKATREEQRFYL